MMIKPLSPIRQTLAKLQGGHLSFGQMIESIRLCDDISQATLARRLDISRAQLCDIEKGRRTVTPERAARFAEVLGYGVHSFVATALEDQLRKAGLVYKVTLVAA